MAGWGRGWGGAFEGSLLDGHVGVEVDVGGSQVGVSEPAGDDGGVDTGLEQGHRAAVTEHVGVEGVGADRGASCRCGVGVFVDEAFNGVGAQASSGACRE